MEFKASFSGGRVAARYLSGEGWSLDATNISNSSNSTCNPLLEDVNLTDGKIPELMGIAVAVWLVS